MFIKFALAATVLVLCIAGTIAFSKRCDNERGFYLGGAKIAGC